MNRRKFLGVAVVLPALPVLASRPGSNKLPAKLDHSGSLGMAMPKLDGAASRYDPAWSFANDPNSGVHKAEDDIKFIKMTVDGSTAYVPVF